MPYVSDSARRLFHAKLARGEMKKKTVDEFDKASRGKDLPEYKAFGGSIKVPEDYGYDYEGKLHPAGWDENFQNPAEHEEFPNQDDYASKYDSFPAQENEAEFVPYEKQGYARGGRVYKAYGGSVPMARGGTAFLQAIKRTGRR